MNLAVTLYCRAEPGLILVVNVFSVQSLNPAHQIVKTAASHVTVITLRNQEIERIGGEVFESIGALLMFGLTKHVKMPLRNSRYPCDAVLAQIAKKTSPECVIDTDKPILIRAEVRSIQPLDPLELISNAKVIKKVSLKNRSPQGLEACTLLHLRVSYWAEFILVKPHPIVPGATMAQCCT